MMYSSDMNMNAVDMNDSLIDGGALAEDDYDEPPPNLEVIYQAFGEQADLYKDVLQVKMSATAEQIQMAYFDRRSELFALLASIDSEEEQDDITASHRFHAERKMDAVVMAVRILGDPQLREEYDNVVILAQAKKQPREPPSGSSGASRSSSTREPDGVYAGVGVDPNGNEVPPSPRATRSPKRRSPKRRSPRHVSPSDNDTDTFNATFDDHIQSTTSGDMLVMHPPYHHSHPHPTEPDYDFILPSPGSKSSKGSKDSNKMKHKKGHKNKKKHHDHDRHHHSSHHHHHSNDLSLEQSTLNQDDATFPDDTAADTFVDTTFQDDTTFGERTWEDQATVASASTIGEWTRDSSRRPIPTGTSTLSNITHGGFVSRIQEEVAGTFEDTLVSFEQVLNVFTLQDRDIQAVMGRIDKAKRQLRKRR